jgi:hypothetical protein
MYRKSNSTSMRNHLKILFSTSIILLLFNAVAAQNNDDKRQAVNRSQLTPGTINIQAQSFWDAFEKLTTDVKLNIIFHASVQQFRNTAVNLQLENVSYPQAIKIFLDRNDLDYVEIDERTIMIVKKSAATAPSKPLEDFVIKANEKDASDQAAANSSASQSPSTDVIFRAMSLLPMIQQLAGVARIAVVLDPQFAENNRMTKVQYFVVRNRTCLHALQLLLDSYDLKYSLLDRRTIKIGVDIANPSAIPLEEIITPREKSN